MARKIKVRRGLEANIKQLDEAEFGFTVNTKKTFIGSDIGNIELANQGSLDEYKADNAKYFINALRPPVPIVGVPTDGSDIGPALTNIINYANGIRVFLPEGDYNLYTEIVRNNTLAETEKIPLKLFGAGLDKTRIFNFVENGSAIRAEANIGADGVGFGVFAKGGYIEDLSILGQIGVANSSGLTISSNWFFDLRKVLIYGHSDYGVNVTGVVGINPDYVASLGLNIKSCILTSNRINLYSDFYNVVPMLLVELSMISTATEYGVKMGPSTHIKFSQNSISGNTLGGIWLYGTSYKGKGIEILNNEFDDNGSGIGDFNIQLERASMPDIKHNMFILRTPGVDGVVLGTDTAITTENVCYFADVDKNTFNVNYDITTVSGNPVGLRCKNSADNTRYGKSFVNLLGETSGKFIHVAETLKTDASRGYINTANTLIENDYRDTPDRYIVGPFRKKRFEVTIAQDSVFSFIPAKANGKLYISKDGYANQTADIRYRCIVGAEVCAHNVVIVGTIVDVSILPLTGTTGTVNRMTVSASGHTIMFENRQGGPVTITFEQGSV